ncbi:hypothetical protein GF337_09690 [candidate division KSB1 bacterium]|nr:hypothetical protein [candidate division KSB1 bacterium]
MQQYILRIILIRQASSFFHLKNLEQAKSAYQRSICHWNELGNIRGIQLCLARLARVAIAEDRISEAVTFYGAAPDPVQIVGILLARIDNTGYHKQLNSLRSAMGEQQWQKAYLRGKSMSPESAMDFAAEY